jgi:hypothetical protein
MIHSDSPSSLAHRKASHRLLTAHPRFARVHGILHQVCHGPDQGVQVVVAHAVPDRRRQVLAPVHDGTMCCSFGDAARVSFLAHARHLSTPAAYRATLTAVDESEYLTEAQAAALVGWTAANLRSHRLRHEAERVALALAPEAAALVLAVRREPVSAEPVGFEGPPLFRREGERWALTQHGLEVARRLGGVLRRSPAPPASVLIQGRVRYRRGDVLDWLDQHPEVANRQRLAAETWSDREAARALGIGPGTLRTMVSRAHVSRRRLDAGEPDPRRRLAYLVQRVPPWIWVGSERRWIPAQVLAWKGRRSAPPDPLAIEPVPDRGPLISEAEAQAIMGVSDSTLVGYRARAGAALRRLGPWRSLAPGVRALPRPLTALDFAGRGPLVVAPPSLGGPGIFAHLPPVSERDIRRARACPPYVLRDGERWYHEQDVRAWVERRGERA